MTDRFFDPNAKYSDTISANADLSNWPKKPDNRGWVLASDTWQEFSEKWRTVDNSVFLPGQVLDVRIPEREPLPRPILIRDCYVKAEEVVWQRAYNQPRTGVILSGQPGIGKTFFLWYFLVRLLRVEQPILLHLTCTASFLFWDCKVYTSPLGKAELPTPSDNSSAFIWSLFDLDETLAPPRIATLMSCFPVQAPSPSDKRYKLWRKERNPLFAAFPLWTREELAIAARHDPEFPRFREYLDNHCRNLKAPGEATYVDAISLLPQTPEEVPKSTDEAFGILLDIVISRFGPIPRDVISAIYDFRSQMELLNGALSVRLQELEDVVREIIRDCQFPHTTSSHRIVSINPTGEIGEEQIWNIAFKSTYIKEQLSEQYVAKSEDQVRLFIKRFSSVPQGKGLAGSLFEPLVHQDITRGTGKWSFYKMPLLRRKVPEPVRFVYDPSTEETCGFLNFQREQVKFSKRGLPKPLANGQYYVPSESNFPLIDSFLVDLDIAARSAQLWVLQMTTSEKHGGSKQGYVEIRKIIGSISELLEKCDSDQPPPAKKLKGPGGKPSIQVHYVLVCPDSQVQRGLEWQLPKGWNEDTELIDHRGDGYLLKFGV